MAAGRAAITEVPADEPRRWTVWSNLSSILRLRFELHGDDEAIELARTALSLADKGGASVPGNPEPPSGRRRAAQSTWPPPFWSGCSATGRRPMPMK